MQDITINGRELAIEFEWASQGHRITVMEYDGQQWETLPEYNGVLCIGSTQFETLCNLSSDLFGDAVYGCDFADALGIEQRTEEDADCLVCGTWAHYEEMISGSAIDHALADKLGLTQWDYACVDCVAKYETVCA